MTSQPISLVPQLYAAGLVPARTCPPTEVQLDHAAPSQCLYQTAPSPPRTKTPIWLPVVAVAAGAEVSFPPRVCQPDHEPPVNHLCHRAPSVPFYKDVETTSAPGAGRCCGIDRNLPADRVPAVTRVPLLVVLSDQTAPSLPRAKTSIWPLLFNVAAGADVIIPPRDVAVDQVQLPVLGFSLPFFT